jgi:hypothetical protein
MKRYFLVTINTGKGSTEFPFHTNSETFFNRKEFEEAVMKERESFVITMIYEFKNEEDYLEFTREPLNPKTIS